MKETNISKGLFSLIPLEDFKAVLGVDDREDKTARFCLVTATLAIEQYCKRKFLRKKYTEISKLNGDLLIPLREYPVTEILVVFASSREITGNKEKIIEPEFYRPMIGNGFNVYYNPKTQEELYQNITDFINYYNNERIQMRFKMSPVQYSRSQNKEALGFS